MELRHLRYFVAIAEAGGVHQASAVLHITQPAVSRQLKDLEEELGVELFERSSRGLKLTPAGVAFREDALALLGGAKRATERARRVAAGEEGHVRVGFIESAAWDGIVPNAFQAFRALHPKLRLEAVPMSSVEQMEAVDDGSLDAGFLYAFDQPSAGLGTVRVRRNKVVLAVPQEWSEAICGRRPPRLAELSARPFIGFPRSTSPHYYDRIASACEHGRLSPTVVQEASNEVAILALVCAGIGVAFVNNANSERSPSRVSFVSVADMNVPLELHLRFRTKSANPALGRFVAALKGLLRKDAA